MRLSGSQIAENGINIFLGCNHDPGTAIANGAKFLGDGLQVEHQVRIATDELAHFVNQEYDAMVLAFLSRYSLTHLQKLSTVKVK